jgi:hypothetical protein
MAYLRSPSVSGPGFGQRELVGWPAQTLGFGEAVAPSVVIDGFAFDRSEINPVQQARIGALAGQILSQNIRSMRLVGHTDPVGTPAYNNNLGQRRADAVRRALFAALERARPGSAVSVAITTGSAAATHTIPGQSATRNRRVEVFLQLPPPSPTPPQPAPEPPPPPSPSRAPREPDRIGPAPANAPRGPECPDGYVCRSTRNFLIERKQVSGTITAKDVEQALAMEHRLLMRNRQAPMVVDPHQSEEYLIWVSKMRVEACQRLKKFAETNWMPFPKC